MYLHRFQASLSESVWSPTGSSSDELPSPLAREAGSISDCGHGEDSAASDDASDFIAGPFSCVRSVCTRFSPSRDEAGENG
jgi:hypothetical protein